MEQQNIDLLEKIKQEGNCAIITVATGKNEKETVVDFKINDCTRVTLGCTICGLLDAVERIKKEYPEEFKKAKELWEEYKKEK